jgi:hypothetical protein
MSQRRMSVGVMTAGGSQSTEGIEGTEGNRTCKGAHMEEDVNADDMPMFRTGGEEQLHHTVWH